MHGSTRIRVQTLALTAALAGAVLAWSSPQARAADAVKLSIDDIAAFEVSSRARSGQADRAMDGRSGTAWIAAWRKGIGATYTVRFKSSRFITLVTLLPGQAGTNKAYRSHCRPKTVELSWANGKQTFEIKDRRRPQYLVLEQVARTRYLTFTIKTLHTQYCRTYDAAISEIAVFEPRHILKRNPKIKRMLAVDLARLGDPAQRHDALKRLVDAGRPAVDYLKKQARNLDDVGSAVDAAAALLRVEARAGRNVIRALLNSGKRAEVLVGLQALREDRVSGVSDALYRIAKSPDPDVSLAAVDALTRSGDPRGLSLLTRALTSDDAARVTVAITNLVHYGSRGREVAARQLSSTVEAERLAALAALSNYRQDATVPTLIIPLTQHGSVLTAQAAVRALGRIPTPEARMALASVASSTRRASMRHAAIAALVRHDDAAVPMLRQLLSEEGEQLGEFVFDQMGKVHTEGILGLILSEMLAELEPVYYPHAERALVAHGEPAVKGLLDHLMAHPEHVNRVAPVMDRLAHAAAIPAARTLRTMPPDRHLDPVRELILDVLGKSGDLLVADEVVKLYHDEAASDRIRRKALTALGDLPSQRSRETVLKAMRHPDGAIANIALEAAGRQGETRAAPLILQMLRDRPARDWTPSIVQAMGHLRTTEAVPLFRYKMGQAKRSVQLAIIRATHKIGGRAATKLLVDASVSRDGSVSRLATALLSR